VHTPSNIETHVNSAAGVGIEPTASWFRARRHYQPRLSRMITRLFNRFAAHTLCAEWAGRRSNPRLRFFRPPLYRLSYQPSCMCPAQKKGPASPVTPGLEKGSREDVRHKRKRCAAAVFADGSANGLRPLQLPEHLDRKVVNMGILESCESVFLRFSEMLDAAFANWFAPFSPISICTMRNRAKLFPRIPD
jgi:hypothetical protein